MRQSEALLIVLFLLGGCVTTPPLSPECSGTLTPINADSGDVQHEIKREARP